MCENNASFDLTSFDIASCIEDASQCMEILMEKEEQGFSDEGIDLNMFVCYMISLLFG